MPEDNKTNTLPTDTSTTPKRKRNPRKALPNATSSPTNRSELTIVGRISGTPKAVSASDFPLFRTFVLNLESSELFIKTTKNSIISLSSGDKFSSSVTGFLVNI